MIDPPENETPTEPAPPKKKRVRRSFGPYKFDRKVAKEILQAIRTGCWLEVAASCAGVTKKTVYNWLQQGARKDASAEMAKFRADFTKAMHFAAKLHVRVIFNAAAIGGNSDASKWFLERRYPKRWGRKDKHELTGPGGKPLGAAVVIELPANGSSPAETVAKATVKPAKDEAG